MSNHAKFLVSMLFIAVIVLCVVLTRFYFDVTKNTESRARDSRAESVIRSFGNMQIFRSVNGHYGISDAGSSAVVIEPEWLEILDVTPQFAVVSGVFDGDILIGGVDYEENIVLPFVFEAMENLGDGYHLGIADEDKSCILYDRKYQPVFQQSFSAVSYHNKLLTAETDGCIFYYDMSGQVPKLQSAEMKCQLFPSEQIVLNWRISNQVYLAELDAADLQTVSQRAAAYMQMLEQNDFSGLSEIAAGESLNSLKKPGILAEMQFDSISRFSFSRRESGAYDFSFRLAYHTASADGTAEVHLYFRKTTENHMLLTAADLQFQNAVPAAEE